MCVRETAEKTGTVANICYIALPFTWRALTKYVGWLNRLGAGTFRYAVLLLSDTYWLYKPHEHWSLCKYHDSYEGITAGSVFYWYAGEQKRAVLYFMSYFSLSPFSLVDPCISDHQSSRLYYYFSTKCFDFQPTQKIKSPPFSQFSPSISSPIYLFLLSFLLSTLRSPMSLSCSISPANFFPIVFFSFIFVIAILYKISNRNQNAPPHEVCFCIVSVLVDKT